MAASKLWLYAAHPKQAVSLSLVQELVQTPLGLAKTLELTPAPERSLFEQECIGPTACLTDLVATPAKAKTPLQQSAAREHIFHLAAKATEYPCWGTHRRTSARRLGQFSAALAFGGAPVSGLQDLVSSWQWLTFPSPKRAHKAYRTPLTDTSNYS